MLARHFGCPTEFTLQLLGGKWKTIILCYLKEGALRYAELRSFMPRLSDKVLTERLKELEASGLIARSAARGSPVVIYRLTSRGEALRSVLTAIYQWGDRHAAAFGVECDNPLRARVKRRLA
jgi:DNA-binding HxlR family transcriptional regulator